ncbi:MAG: lysylphosphatidylglycerol synthase transmembrane domain-containing protein [Blastochloris sp.]|nr:lysylphosphatidylglycerol synthase transmembrane domain-containing protein [Blastochloris sp.]
MSRPSWSFILRIAITALGVGYLFFFKDWTHIWTAVHQVKVGWLLLAFLAYGMTTSLGIARWHLLLVKGGADLGWLRTAQLTLIGLFANTFMPGAMGGDFIKAVLIAREKPQIKPTVVMSIVMERILGFVAMFMISTTLIMTRIGPLTEEFATRLAVILYFVVFTLTLGALALGVWKHPSLWVPFWHKLPLRSALDEAGEAYRFFLTNRGCFWGGLGYSVAAHFFLLISCFCVALGLGLNLDFWDLSAVLPLVALVTLIVPSIGGLGIRELAFQHFLTYVSITKETSIALSLVFYAVTLTWGMLGGLIYLRAGASRKPVEKE